MPCISVRGTPPDEQIEHEVTLAHHLSRHALLQCHRERDRDEAEKLDQLFPDIMRCRIIIDACRAIDQCGSFGEAIVEARRWALRSGTLTNSCPEVFDQRS